MSNVVYVPRLIAEVQKRPAIWDSRQKARSCVPSLWQEVSQNVGIDANQCKRKWKNLRDAYRAEVRRCGRRLKRDKLMGLYEPGHARYKSKWVYFPSLNFLNVSRPNYDSSIDKEDSNSDSIDNYPPDETYKSGDIDENFVRVCNIKLEPRSAGQDKVNLVVDDDDTANDLLFEEFQSIATPQAARRFSATFSGSNAYAENSQSTPLKVNSPSANVSNCKCSKRNDDQVHFLEDLGREEQRLMKSTRQDITRSNKLDHVGDSDYNFLVSFLPQMKKMSELQNLQFRSKMCETVLNILASTVTQDPISINEEQ